MNLYCLCFRIVVPGTKTEPVMVSRGGRRFQSVDLARDCARREYRPSKAVHTGIVDMGDMKVVEAIDGGMDAGDIVIAIGPGGSP